MVAVLRCSMIRLLMLFRCLLLLWYNVESDGIARRLRSFVRILILEQAFELLLGFRLNTAHTVLTALCLWPFSTCPILISLRRSTTRDLAPVMVFFSLQMLLLQLLRAYEAGLAV